MKMQRSLLTLLIGLAATTGGVLVLTLTPSWATGSPDSPSAVVDRIEDDRWVVLLVGDAERECVLPLAAAGGAAADGRNLVGTWGALSVTECSATGGSSPIFTVDQSRTDAARHRIEAKIQELRTREKTRNVGGPSGVTD